MDPADQTPPAPPTGPFPSGPPAAGSPQPGGPQPGQYRVDAPPAGSFQATPPPTGPFQPGPTFQAGQPHQPGQPQQTNPAFGGQYAAPYGSFPYGSAPLDSPPFGSSPFGSAPDGSGQPYQPYQPGPLGTTPAPTTTRNRLPHWFVVSLVVAVILSTLGTLAAVDLAGGFAGSGSGTAATATPLAPRPDGGSWGNGSSGNGSSGNGSSGSSNPSSNGSTGALDVSAVAAKVTPGIVNINTELGYQQAAAAGTGMVLTSSGQILTNNHVIDGATQIVATVVETGKEYEATVVGTDPTDDVAVLQLKDASDLSTITIGDSDKVAAGDPVVALGNAGGKGGAPTVVSGTVTDTDQAITASDQNGANAERLTGLIQVAAAIEAGDSGGPLANAAGEVIGMNTAASGGTRFESKVNVGFAIPIANAMDIVKEIESGKETDKIHIGLPGFLGVAVVPSGSGQGDPFQRSTVAGAEVAGVTEGSPAEKAGLTEGDTITSVGGRKVASAEELTAAMHLLDPGTRSTIGWTDVDGKTHTAEVTLAAGPA